ncbi:hypothetical protein [Paraburkholderia youngii]|uniref:hypothetical protein n=1 Tax=Paraburkholderia youngii TaxID=2782701 RepID=UPI003D1EFE02
MNTYQLAARGETTVWNPATNDVNGVNAFGMRPIEVAAQAGNVGEFVSIMNNPGFNPVGARPAFFVEVGLGSGGFESETQRVKALRLQLAEYRSRFQ